LHTNGFPSADVCVACDAQTHAVDPFALALTALAGHAVHLVAPRDAVYVFFPQGRQAADVKKPPWEYLPAGHAAQRCGDT